MARRAICTGDCPATIGRVSTPTCLPSTASCSIAAGRLVSREAISVLRRICSLRRRAILAVVVVLPEPCSPTIMIGTGAGALRSIGSAVAPSVSMSWSWTILTIIWPGVTDFTTSTPTARSRTRSTNSAHHVEGDIGLQQRAADLPRRRVDIGRGERAAARQPVENAGQLVGQAFEHQTAPITSND